MRKHSEWTKDIFPLADRHVGLGDTIVFKSTSNGDIQHGIVTSLRPNGMPIVTFYPRYAEGDKDPSRKTIFDPDGYSISEVYVVVEHKPLVSSGLAR